MHLIYLVVWTIQTRFLEDTRSKFILVLIGERKITRHNSLMTTIVKILITTTNNIQCIGQAISLNYWIFEFKLKKVKLSLNESNWYYLAVWNLGSSGFTTLLESVCERKTLPPDNVWFSCEMFGAVTIGIICFVFGTVEVAASLFPLLLVLLIVVPIFMSPVVFCWSRAGSEEWSIIFWLGCSFMWFSFSLLLKRYWQMGYEYKYSVFTI